MIYCQVWFFKGNMLKSFSELLNRRDDIMSIFLEPVYLNEKRVLNAAAYLFKGYSLESESVAEESSANK